MKSRRPPRCPGRCLPALAVLLASLGTAAVGSYEPTEPAVHESQVVGLSLQGARKAHRLMLDDLDAIVVSAGDRRIPLLRILKALQIDYSYEFDELTITGVGSDPVVIDVGASVSRAGDTERPIEVITAMSEITGKEDLFVRPQALGELLSIHLQWDEMEYAFRGRTSRKWPVWRREDSAWILPQDVVQTELELPEMFTTASPTRSSVGFMELQARFRNASGDGPVEDFGYASSRASLWGTLGGGNYKMQLVSTRDTEAVIDNASWNYRLENSEIAAGDSIFGLSDLVFPSMRVFGVRFNGIRGLVGEDDRTSLGLRQRFAQSRVFEGMAPAGSKVSLVIDGRVIDEQEIFPDVASAPGFGQYRFEDVLLRTGLLNDIRVIVLEPNGTIHETRKNLVQSPLIAPRGTFGFLGGIGTDRRRLDYETQGLFGGFRAVYGVTDNLTISGAVGVQDGLYDGLGDLSSQFPGFPDSSANVGAQIAWRPAGELLFSADVAMSRVENAGPESESYADTAVRITNEYYPTRRVKLRAHLFRYGPEFFNGQNLNLRDRQGFSLDGRFGILKRSVLEFSLADLSGHLDGNGDFESEAGFQHLAFSTSSIPRTTLTATYNRLDANWSDEVKDALNLETQTFLPWGVGVRARIFTGDSFTDSQTSRFFSGLNLAGVSVFVPTDRSVSVSKQFRQRGTLGVSYLENPFYYRPLLFGSTTFRLLGRPLAMGMALGYDALDEELSDEGTEPYFESQTDFYLSNYGKSRLGLRTRLQRGSWSTSFNMSFLTSVNQGVRARLLKSSIRPDQGGVHGTVFLDYNANGLRERGEPGVSNVEVHMGSRSRIVTDARGYFIMSGPDKPKDTKVYLDLESVPAYYSASHGKQSARLRPGQMTRVNLGLTPLIAVTGFVLAEDFSGKTKPLIGARVVLRKSSLTEQTKESYTGRDGSFYIGDVRPGDYSLEVDPETIPENHTVIAGPGTLTISPDKKSQEIGVSAFLAQVFDPDRPILAEKRVAPDEPAPVTTAEVDLPDDEPLVDTLALARLEAPPLLTETQMLPPFVEPAPVTTAEVDLPDDEPLVDTLALARLEVPPLLTETQMLPPYVEPEPVLPGGLDVNWQPWATIKIEGYPELISPCSFEGLEPGTYQVTVAHPDLGQLTRQVEIYAGEHSRLAGGFRNIGTLSVNAAPWADVLIDGEPRGSTPLQLSLSEGKHTVALVNRTTAEVVSFAVDMPRGGTKRVRHEF